MKISMNYCYIMDIITNACVSKGVGAIRLEKGGAATGSLMLEENVLIFVLKGRFEFYYGETAFVATEHQLVYLRKDVLIEYRSGDETNEEVRFLLFVLDTQVVVEFAKTGQLAVNRVLEPAMVVVNDANYNMLSYMNTLEFYLQDGGFMRESLVRIKLLELLFCVAGNSRQMIEEILAVRENYHADITQIVEENITNAVSLKQMAYLAGRSLSSFRRDFLFIYNMPPSKYIRLKRLDKARELLLGTKMSVSAVCYTLGFESISHFSRLFKSRFGFPPSELRVHYLQES